MPPPSAPPWYAPAPTAAAGATTDTWPHPAPTGVDVDSFIAAAGDPALTWDALRGQWATLFPSRPPPPPPEFSPFSPQWSSRRTCKVYVIPYPKGDLAASPIITSSIDVYNEHASGPGNGGGCAFPNTRTKLRNRSEPGSARTPHTDAVAHILHTCLTLPAFAEGLCSNCLVRHLPAPCPDPVRDLHPFLLAVDPLVSCTLCKTRHLPRQCPPPAAHRGHPSAGGAGGGQSCS